MPASIDKMCRTCMFNETKCYDAGSKNKVQMKGTQMVSIFGVQQEAKEKLNLVEIIKATVPQLKIEKNDQLPKRICFECSEKIKEIYNFQQNCIENEKKFYKMLESEESLNVIDETEGKDDYEVLKTEFNESFINENSLNSEEEAVMEEEINEAALAKEEFIESCSDWSSIDLVWDDKSDIEYDQRRMQSNSISEIHKREEFDDEIFETYSYDDDEDVKHDDFAVNEIHNKTANKNISISDKHPTTENQQLYPCSKCRRKLKSKTALKKHLELHLKRDNGEPKFVCNICDRTFSQSYMLKDHLRTHSGEKPYLCSECGKSFTSSGSLKQHSYRHLNQKQFPCPDCPKQFPTKTDLASHSDVHNARPRTHICDICGRGFPKPFLLKKHKMYHSDDRPYTCEYCGKCFITNEKLQRHVRIHTGEKPYKCNFCDKAYCQSNELTKHLRNHLGDNVYQCELCPLRFPTVKAVREHYSTHKNDDEETKARNLAHLNTMELKGIYCR